MRQLLLPGSLEPGRRVTIRDSEYHYLMHVRRYAVGDELDAVDHHGRRGRVRIVEAGVESAEIEVLSTESDSPEQTEIVVYQGLPKAKKLDDVIRSLVQAGVRRLVPVQCERSLVRAADLGSARPERWQRIAQEAVQQSGALPMTIDPPRPLTEILASGTFPGDSGSAPHCSLFLHTEPLAHKSLHRYLGTAVSRLSLFVGPEGGFSPAECDRFIGVGIEPLWLGPRVYRTEVAGLAAVAAAQLLLVEREDWQPVM